MKLDRREVRPVGGHSRIIVRYSEKPIEALVDIGSNVTIAGSNISEKHQWKIRHAELKSLETANGECMIDGIVTEKAYSVRHLHFTRSGRPNTWKGLGEETGPNAAGFRGTANSVRRLRILSGLRILYRTLKELYKCCIIIIIMSSGQLFGEKPKRVVDGSVPKKDVVLLLKQEWIVPDRLSRNTRKTGLS